MITSTHTALLDIPSLPRAARQAHIFPALSNSALLSISQFCDNGFEAHFDATHVRIMRDSTIALQGDRDASTGLWTIGLQPDVPRPSHTSLQLANNVHDLQRKRDIVKYLHRACFSPVPSTWLKAIEAGNFTTWPGLTTELVKKHLNKSIATAKGHLRQTQQNLRSTQTKNEAATAPMPSTLSPPRTSCVYMQQVTITGQIHSDQTGRFPITSSRGSKYIMVVYDYDSNAILAEPLKSRTEQELLRAYTKIHTYLTVRGLKPVLQRLDNEAPGQLKQFMRTHDVQFQLVPPHNHRRNAAEKAIGTWKDHFIAGLSSLDPNFPMHLWCRLIPQATTTLNLLRQSRINPRLSAEAQLNGAFDFNKNPFAPPGTRILIHEQPKQRRTWAAHGIDGWYLGNAPEHYRCYRVYATRTAAERIADTVEFFPYNCPMPKTSSADAATTAAADLIHALRNPSPATPFGLIGDAQLTALATLATIFQTAAQPPTSPSKHLTTPPRVPPAPPRKPLPPTAPRVPGTTPQSPPRQGPHLIPTDDDEPISRHCEQPNVNDTIAPHRYPLRSRHSANHVVHDYLPSNHHQANGVVDPLTGQVQEYRHLLKGSEKDIWTKSFANELGRLAQGVGTRMPSGTDTIFFIDKKQVPHDRTVTYGRIVATIRPQKTETHRTRLTVGGDRLDYPGEVSTPTAKLTTAKCLLNSTISTPDARFMGVDIKDFYLNTPLERYEYMRLPLSLIPLEVAQQYNLTTLASASGWIYIEIRKGMYGLKQAGLLANQRLTAHLAKYGYRPTPRTPGLWRHDQRNLTFCLVVDDFGVKYVGREHAQHLVNALQDLYTVSTDWTGTLYCGLTITWDYPRRHVDISMPGYVAAALHKFQHPAPAQPEDAPHAWQVPAYGATIQYAPDHDTSKPLPPPQVTRIQQVIGTLLYYSIAVDPTMLVALGTIAAAQSQATEHTAHAVVRLLNYAASHPDAVIRYKASGMTLHIHSDASYLSEPKARSRAGGHFFLSRQPLDPTAAPVNQPPQNGPIHTTCHILRNVMPSAAEAETGALFVNGQEAIPLRTTLEELGHAQPPTPLQTDNSTAAGFSNATIKQKRSKAMDMRFYWLQDRVRQGQFLIYWRPGTDNLGDYYTKHHPASHHRRIRHHFLHPPAGPLTFTPCEGVSVPAFPDAAQTPRSQPIPALTDAAQTTSLQSPQSRARNIIRVIGRAANRIVNSPLSY